MSLPSAPPVAVLDTSVLYPAWSRLLLQRLAAGQPPAFRGIWSREIIRELWQTVSDRSSARGLAPETVQNRVRGMLYPLQQVLVLVESAGHPPAAPPSPLRDPDDTHLWNAALHAQAAYIVSHNTRDFPPPVRVGTGSEPGLRHLAHGVEFLTAIEFVEEVLGFDAAVLYGAPLPPRGLVRSARS